MKLAENFKIADVVIQALAFLAPVVISALPPEVSHVSHSDGWMWFYFAVGGVQFTSCVLNLIFLKRGMRGISRVGYEVLLGLITFLAIATSAMPHGSDIGGVLLFFLVFVSPIMAVWYFILSIREVAIVKAYTKPDAEIFELSSSYDQLL